MHLIIGATGPTGSQALADLVADGQPTRAIVREASKLSTTPNEVIDGSVQNPGTLRKAMTDVACLYLSLGSFPGQEDAELATISATQATDVAKIVKLSGPSAGPASPVAIARMHGRIETAITDAGGD